MSSMYGMLLGFLQSLFSSILQQHQFHLGIVQAGVHLNARKQKTTLMALRNRSLIISCYKKSGGRQSRAATVVCDLLCSHMLPHGYNMAAASTGLISTFRAGGKNKRSISSESLSLYGESKALPRNTFPISLSSSM